MSHPETSVIIPTFNSSQYIVETLQSVLNQTYSAYEIIIVDDGSTDSTKHILKPFLNDQRIRYVYKENGGQPSARNVGIANAKGAFIAFLDADDLWLPEKLSQQIPLFEKENVGGCHCPTINFESETGKIIDLVPFHSKAIPRRGDIFYNLIVENYVAHSTLVARATTLRKIGGFDETIKMGDDWDLNLRLSAECDFEHVDTPLVKYRVNRPNCVSSKKLLRFDQDEAIVRKMFSLYQNRIPRRVIRASLARRFQVRGQYYTSVNDIFRSIYWYLKAILQRPNDIRYYRGILKAVLTRFTGYSPE